MPQDAIKIVGARQHNLKNVSVEIPKHKLVVFTGLSGSGKSSLAFDTLYAEGQRRYVESLSAYARQFLGLMEKPDVDQIDGLSPAISIDQKTTSHNPRSTVGTITEIYDYLRLLYARVGHPHCPLCDRELARLSIDQIVEFMLESFDQQAAQTSVRALILAPVVRDRKGEFSTLFETLRKKGYQRIRVDGQFFNLDDEPTLIKTNKHTIEVLLDRIVLSAKQLRDDTERKRLRSRLNQVGEEAIKLSDGFVSLGIVNDDSLQFPENPSKLEIKHFSEQLTCPNDGFSFGELEPRLFSFNSPHGACPTCNGLGTLLKIDVEKMLAPSLSLSEGAIVPFARMMSNDTWWARTVRTIVDQAGISFRTTAWKDFPPQLQQELLYGSDKIYSVTGQNRFGSTTTIEEQFEGFVTNLERRYNETDSDFIRREIAQYMQKQVCETCLGYRLKPESLKVLINKTNIGQLTEKTITDSLKWFHTLQKESILTPTEQTISESIIKEISERLSFLSAVGLGYLTLSREAGTLAGGEAQRIRLASQIGTGLTGVLYILDEPTIGLHQRDNDRLIATLKQLRDRGNSVLVVEHDRDLMLAADYLLDFGPAAGKNGGEIVATGTPQELSQNSASLTGKYLRRKKDIARQAPLNEQKLVSDDQLANLGSIKIEGARHHNLQQLDVDFPLGKLIAITGISGSGKSTLLHDTLYAHLAKHLGKTSTDKAGHIDRIMVPDEVKRVSLIDQSPIGKTPRSNPATYTKVFDYIRKLFANTQDAQVRGYNAGRFSFNVKGGRCENCQGDGQIKIEMQFLPDVYVKCDVCDGQRYNQETLEVKYRGKNIAQVLQMSVEEAFQFFSHQPTLRQKLQTLLDVGLGYIELGQPAPTLSGGEAQRVKLAKELSVRVHEHVVYLLDEPTTGLHFADVQNLLNVLDQLIKQNNTVIVIEHNLDIIKNADWIIDLGPEGGEYGGQVVAEGTPQQVAQNPNSFTGEYLKVELEANNS